MEESGIYRVLETVRDATLDGRSWHAVAGAISREFDAAGVAFYGQSTDINAFKETAVLGIGPDYIDAYKHHFSRYDNPWITAIPFWKPGAIRTERALKQFTGDHLILRRSGYFRDWIQPQGFAHSMGMVLDHDAESYIKLTLYRGTDAGAYEDHDVARFVLLCRQFRTLLDLASRYRLARTMLQLSLQALDYLDFGVVLLSGNGRVVELNRFARDLLGEGVDVVRDRLVLRDPRASRLLEAALTTTPAATVQSGPIAVAPPAAKRPMTLSVVPGVIDGPESGWLLFITCPDKVIDGRLTALTSRFNLTAVELRLAIGLLQGSNLRTAAAQTGLTYETARWYLKQLFAKTQTHSQAALVGTLLQTSSGLGFIQDG